MTNPNAAASAKVFTIEPPKDDVYDHPYKFGKALSYLSDRQQVRLLIVGGRFEERKTLGHLHAGLGHHGDLWSRSGSTGRPRNGVTVFGESIVLAISAPEASTALRSAPPRPRTSRWISTCPRPGNPTMGAASPRPCWSQLQATKHRWCPLTGEYDIGSNTVHYQVPLGLVQNAVFVPVVGLTGTGTINITGIRPNEPATLQPTRGSTMTSR